VGRISPEVKDQILRSKLINLEVKSRIAVTEEEIKGFYEKHQADYAGVKQYHLGSIVVRVFPEATDEEIAAAQERAKSIEMMLKTGAEEPLRSGRSGVPGVNRVPAATGGCVL